jgi:hypothetical protein
VVLVVLDVHALPVARGESFRACVETTARHHDLLLAALATHDAKVGATGERLRGKRCRQQAKQS